MVAFSLLLPLVMFGLDLEGFLGFLFEEFETLLPFIDCVFTSDFDFDFFFFVLVCDMDDNAIIVAAVEADMVSAGVKLR